MQKRHRRIDYYRLRHLSHSSALSRDDFARNALSILHTLSPVRVARECAEWGESFVIPSLSAYDDPLLTPQFTRCRDLLIAREIKHDLSSEGPDNVRLLFNLWSNHHLKLPFGVGSMLTGMFVRNNVWGPGRFATAFRRVASQERPLNWESLIVTRNVWWRNSTLVSLCRLKLSNYVDRRGLWCWW